MALEILYLANPDHILPMPGKPGIIFSPAGEIVECDDPFWWNLLADGSLTHHAPSQTAPAASTVQPATAEPLHAE